MDIFTELLNKLKPENGSGVLDFDKAEFEKLKKNKNKEELLGEEDKAFEKALGLFQNEKYSEVLDYLYEDPSRISRNETKAIKFLTELQLGFKPQTKSLIQRDDFYSYKKDFVFSEALINLYKELKLDGVDFFDYAEDLVQLNYSWIKSLLFDKNANLQEQDFENFLEKLEKSFAKIKARYEDEDIINHYEERMLYLKALIHKKLKKTEDAKKYFNEYFDKSLDREERISKLVLLGNEKSFKEDEVLTKLEELYREASEIMGFIDETSLLTNDTCGSYGCADCCHYTYPSMSLTEFEYIKSWAKENNYDFSDAIANAKEIQENYKKESGGKVFKIENKNDDLELNPEDFKFPCPFLKDERCSIHPARPLLCRVFGLGSSDGKYLKSCNYYLNQYQHMSSPENERLVYDSRAFQSMLDESDKYLTEQDEAKTGLIPAFLSDLSESEE